MPPFRATYSYNPNSAATSPDGIQNYLLRTVPTLVAGQNTSDVAGITQPGRGQAVVGVNPNFPNLKVHEWNAMIEKEVGRSMVYPYPLQRQARDQRGPAKRPESTGTRLRLVYDHGSATAPGQFCVGREATVRPERLYVGAVTLKDLATSTPNY